MLQPKMKYSLQRGTNDEEGSSIAKLAPVWPDMKVLDDMFRVKVAQICGDLFGYFENIKIRVKTTASTYVLWNAWKNLGVF